MKKDVMTTIELRGFFLSERRHQSHFLSERALGNRAASLGSTPGPPKPPRNGQQTVDSRLHERSRAVYGRKDTLGVAGSAQSQRSQGVCWERTGRGPEPL